MINPVTAQLAIIGNDLLNVVRGALHNASGSYVIFDRNFIEQKLLDYDMQMHDAESRKIKGILEQKDKDHG